VPHNDVPNLSLEINFENELTSSDFKALSWKPWLYFSYQWKDLHSLNMK